MLNFLPAGLRNQFSEAFEILFAVGPYIVPFALLYIFAVTWLNYVRAHYRANINWALIEVRLPREATKPVSAMEVVLQVFHQTTTGTWFDRVWKGRLKAWSSFEIVSTEGRVHFFIYVNRFFLPIVESRIYSQYPEAEIHEVDDYTHAVNFSRESADWDLFGTEFRLSKEDPYPIKTYMDYKLDELPREQKTQVDPLTALIELFGSVGKGEQFWLQILVRASGDNRYKVPGTWFRRRNWKEEGLALVKKLRERKGKPGEIVLYDTRVLSPGEEQLVKDVERNLTKPAFDVGIRTLYLARKDVFNHSYKPAIVTLLKQFNAEDRNGFKDRSNRRTDFDYPWQDFRDMRLMYRKRTLFSAYKTRSYFYQPYVRHPFVLSSEELATVYHFPGAVAETPTFQRIPSRTSEPPPDLPR